MPAVDSLRRVAARLLPGALERIGAAIGALLFVLRICVTVRRPEVFGEGLDTALALAQGATADLLLGLGIAAGAGLARRPLPRVGPAGVVLLATGAITAVSVIDGEYFAFGGNHLDSWFFAYLLDGGVNASALSGTALLPIGLVAGVGLAGGTALARAAARAAFEEPAWRLALVLVVGCAGSIGVSRADRPEASLRALALSRSAPAELLVVVAGVATPWPGLRPGGTPPVPEERARPAIDLMRKFLNGPGGRTYTDPQHPLAVRLGPGPAGAIGPHGPLNVIFVVLEGMQTHVLREAGSRETLTPVLDGLVAKHLWWRNFFATGAHTARALDAAICGLAPSMSGPPPSMHDPELPVRCLPAILAEHGIRTGFLSGAHARFEQARRWFGRNGFESLVFYEDFRPQPPLSNDWGASDAEIYGRALAWVDAHRGAPFFLNVLTLSNHHPYALPATEPASTTPEEDRWKDTTRYADRELGRFVDGLAARGVLDDTVVFIFGDHGLDRVNLFASVGVDLPRRFLDNSNVPLVVLAPEGLLPRRRIDRVASQADLLPTVLELLRIDAPHHAAGNTLSWTWGAELDLPTAVFNNYPVAGARIDPGIAHLARFDPEGRSPILAAEWSRDSTGALTARPRAVTDRSIRDLMLAVESLHRARRWWPPSEAGASAPTADAGP